MQHPVELEYGIVHSLHYLMDFGRVEACVRLYMVDAAPEDKGVEIITSVSALVNETEHSLKTRLVYSAARLFRQLEASQMQVASNPHFDRVA